LAQLRRNLFAKNRLQHIVAGHFSASIIHIPAVFHNLATKGLERDTAGDTLASRTLPETQDLVNFSKASGRTVIGTPYSKAESKIGWSCAQCDHVSRCTEMALKLTKNSQPPEDLLADCDLQVP